MRLTRVDMRLILSPIHPPKVSSKGQNFSSGASVFTYVQSIGVATLNPSWGPSSGGSGVLILGDHFLNTTTAACKFGSNAVPAKFISHETMMCTAPQNYIGKVQVGVTSNGQDFPPLRAFFDYFSPVSVVSAWPHFGSGSRGGTSVTVRGQGFQQTSELSCMFGQLSATETSWLGPTTIVCKTPPHHPGLVSIRVTNNGADFSSDVVDFWFVHDAAIDEIMPKQMLETGQVATFISGSNFINTTSLTCKVGNMVLRGLFLSPELMACMAPSHAEQLRLQHRVGRISIEVSTNGLDYTESGRMIEYTKGSPPGHYDGGGIPVVTPNGTYSSGAGSLNFTVCQPGSFQPFSGAATCLPCPIGFMCPGESP